VAEVAVNTFVDSKTFLAEFAYAVQLLAVEPLLYGHDPEVISAAAQALAVCVNRLLEDVPSGYVCPVLHKVLFFEGTSWQESIDILAVIREIDMRLFIGTLGEAALMEMIEAMIAFCFGSKESLTLLQRVVIIRLSPLRADSRMVARSVKKFGFLNESRLLCAKVLLGV
jgi:hypothetical protein